MEKMSLRPNDPQKLTGVSTMTHYFQIALTPKLVRLVRTFFHRVLVWVRLSFSKKSPHKSSSSQQYRNYKNYQGI